jgi:uncharacterized protein YbjT (DUF2867 family)
VKRVLVTGATGKIGSQLIPRLVEQPALAVRAFARNATKAAPLARAGAELVLGSLEDSRALSLATRGVDTVVLITPASPNAVHQARAVLAAARDAGVRKVVRVSVFNAASDGPSEVTRQHGSTDAEIRYSGLTYTILRPPFFMQNLCFLAGESIATEGKLYFGTGQGRLAMIDLRDIVDCAEECLTSDAYDNKIFTLTGPESIGFQDIAARLSNLLARPVHYVPVRPEAVEQYIRTMGQSEWYARVMRDLCRAYSEDWGDVITGDVAHITGRRPRTFDVFAREIFLPTLSLRPRCQAPALQQTPRVAREEVEIRV